jgi:hypothetical protein
MRNGFPPGVAEKLGWYVYRLIDPRNGETFYVGKGKNDRIFEHAQGSVGDQEDALGMKLARIRSILAAGLDVIHVVHHHGIDDEETAYRIETAAMDCYPGLTNLMGGHGGGQFGARHVEQIISDYAALEFEPRERILAISIGQTHSERSIYDAVRGVWKLDIERARQQEIVLAVIGRIVRGVFRAKEWVPATVDNFPHLTEDIPGRIGFIGVIAEPPVVERYLNRLVPRAYQHGQNPVRFIPPTGS